MKKFHEGPDFGAAIKDEVHTVSGGADHAAGTGLVVAESLGMMDGVRRMLTALRLERYAAKA